MRKVFVFGIGEKLSSFAEYSDCGKSGESVKQSDIFLYSSANKPSTVANRRTFCNSKPFNLFNLAKEIAREKTAHKLHGKNRRTQQTHSFS
jgi:hypothetical protein